MRTRSVEVRTWERMQLSRQDKRQSSVEKMLQQRKTMQDNARVDGHVILFIAPSIHFLSSSPSLPLSLSCFLTPFVPLPLPSPLLFLCPSLTLFLSVPLVSSPASLALVAL
eukprot:6187538-Pleurochrysis_carterae.AAC.1